MKYNKKSADLAEQNFINDPSIKNRNALILHHENLIHLFANRYKNKVDPGLYKDMVQEGMLGLMRAATTFDGTKNIKFITYAGLWVRSSIQKYLMQERSQVYGVFKSRALGHRKDKPSTALIQAVRLDEEITTSHEGGQVNIHEIIPDTSNPTEEDLLNVISAENIFDKIEKHLDSPVKITIFRDRMISDSPRTLDDIGKEYSFSKEGIRLKELSLLKEMKKTIDSEV